MTQDMTTLGFDQIIQQLQDQAVSRAARRRLGETEPIMNEGLCRARMEETTAARCVMENAGTPPLTDTDGTETGLIQAAQGGMLLPAKKEGSFERFSMGDSVMLLPDRKNAIVYQPADDEGNVIIQMQDRKMTVRHNRLKLLVPAEQLYPPEYDFSIVFDTVANRKAAHTMDRKFDPDAVIIVKEGKKELKSSVSFTRSKRERSCRLRKKTSDPEA